MWLHDLYLTHAADPGTGSYSIASVKQLINYLSVLQKVKERSDDEVHMGLLGEYSDPLPLLQSVIEAGKPLSPEAWRDKNLTADSNPGLQQAPIFAQLSEQERYKNHTSSNITAHRR